MLSLSDTDTDLHDVSVCLRVLKMSFWLLYFVWPVMALLSPHTLPIMVIAHLHTLTHKDTHVNHCSSIIVGRFTCIPPILTLTLTIKTKCLSLIQTLT